MLVILKKEPWLFKNNQNILLRWHQALAILIKNGGNFLKHKKAFIVFFTCFAVSIVARTLQLIFINEPETGFVKPEYMPVAVVLAVSLVVALTAIFLLAKFSGSHPTGLKKRSVPLAAISFAMAGAIVFEIITTVLKQPFYPAYLILILLLLGCIAFFIMMGSSQISDRKLPASLALILVIYWIARLIVTFMSFTGIANISENVIETGTLCFSLIFLLDHGKILSGVNAEKSMRWIFPTGLMASLLCGLSALPRYILIISGNGSLIHEGIIPTPVYLILCVYIVVFLLNLTSKSEKRAAAPGDFSVIEGDGDDPDNDSDLFDAD